MKTVLVLGAGGMLGNAVAKLLGQADGIACVPVFSKGAGEVLVVDETLHQRIPALLKKHAPHYVVNCIGVLRPAPEDAARAYFVNSYFPQALARYCDAQGARLIHQSTDGVFSGARGGYAPGDVPDATDLYGTSKLLGEVQRLPHVTIRSSLIGREVGSKKNLLEWFLAAQDSVEGYANVISNALTTLTLAKIVRKIIAEDLSFPAPVLHFCSEPHSRYELLCLFRDVFGRNTMVRKGAAKDARNLSLLPSPEQERFSEIIPPMRAQLEELKAFYG